MKPLYIILMLAFSACQTTNSVQAQAEEIGWIGFNWVETEISGKSYSKAAIEIPVILNDLEEKLSMQFDIGAQQSFFDENSISHLQDMDKSLAKVDTLEYDEENYDLIIKDIHLASLENYELASSVVYYPEEGEKYDESGGKGTFSIGTLGADILRDKILIIDYPNSRLAIVNEMPDSYRVQFVQAESTYGKINIPVEINGEIKYLLYDTGASIFQIATSPAGYQLLNPEKVATDSLQVPSFGAMLDFIGGQSSSELKIGNKLISGPFVYYSENENVISFFEESQIFGLTGNALFLDNIVVINYKNNQFGIAE